jgi:hypothetical protein
MNSSLQNKIATMPPRSLSERSPLSVMRWSDDYSTSSSVELSKPNSKGPLPLSKSVTIIDKHEIFPITHLNDIPEHEVKATWYDSKEYSEIKSAYQMTIFMMEAGETISGNEHTSRGLEYRTQEGAWARYENKRDAYNAVLDEQDRQWKVDKDDDEKIRQIYQIHSKKCAEAAVGRALQDRRDSREYQLEMTAEDKLKLRKKAKLAKERAEKIHVGATVKKVKTVKTKKAASTDKNSNTTATDKKELSEKRAKTAPSTDKTPKSPTRTLSRCSSERIERSRFVVRQSSDDTKLTSKNRLNDRRVGT